jgi:hypothetical protein
MGWTAWCVLVDGTPQHRAWTLIIQSKQTMEDKHVTVINIFRNFQSDTRHTHRLPRPQPEVWAEWHEKDLKEGEKKPVPSIPMSTPIPGSVHTNVKGKALREALALERLGYVFVSDGTVSAQQDALYDKMVRDGHPYTDFIIIVSAAHSSSLYGRMGALQRSRFRKSVTEKLVA